EAETAPRFAPGPRRNARENRGRVLHCRRTRADSQENSRRHLSKRLVPGAHNQNPLAAVGTPKNPHKRDSFYPEDFPLGSRQGPPAVPPSRSRAGATTKESRRFAPSRRSNVGS